jgi:glutamine amidotransferase-like uncharacterized protein
MKPKVAVFFHHPECSAQSMGGILQSLLESFNVQIFTKEDIKAGFFNGIDMIAIPGGIGDADTYHSIFKRKAETEIANYIEKGGRYLGVCMGAYWAAHWYFDILDDVTCVQYIKQKNASVKRSYSTVIDVKWKDEPQKMFFYDGCTFTGTGKYDTIATYETGQPMAIMQKKIGLIGCHPESMEFWYTTPKLRKHWHSNQHHKLLQQFALQLMEQ